MRSAALASLILAAGVATAAQAQAPATTTTTTTTTTAPQAAATDPAAAAPATQAAPAAPAGVAPTAPAAQAAPAEPPPVLPTTGDGAVVISVLEKVCVPIVRGQSLETVAKANGFKKNRRDNSWSTPLGGDKNYTVIIFDQGANKDVCRGEIHYAIGQEEPILKAINIWSFLHRPQLQLQANYVNTDADGIKRVRRSWEYYDTKTSIAVNFSTMKKPDDTPLNKRYDSAALFYQERKF